MRIRLDVTRLGIAVLFGAGLSACADAALESEDDVGTSAAAMRTEVREAFAPDGSIQRVVAQRPAARTRASLFAVASAEVVPIEVHGDSADHFDLVFVGDGYTADELETYGENVRSKVDELFAVEPFRSYRNRFNVWQVNVVSPESGVDNDPDLGVEHDTALDMGFWCFGIERLLCANDDKVYQYASAVAGVDHVIALANTTTYGGAGGSYATAAGGHPSAGQIVVHELGHSIGYLADEYDYGDGSTYVGDEPGEANTSIYRADVLAAEQRKWHLWLGEPSPDGGVVDAFEGAGYNQFGLFRPTDSSIMRVLGSEYNLPGREAMIAGFYRTTGVIADALGTEAASAAAVLWVKPVTDDTGTIRTSWIVDGKGIDAADGATQLDLGQLALAPGPHTATATVTDATPWVRDPAMRALMTDTRTWTVVSGE